MTTRESVRIRAAAPLLDNLAAKIDQALDHIRYELATQHDSYPTQVPGASIATADGPSAPRVCPECEDEGCDNCGPVETTAVERAVFARDQLARKRDDIGYDVNRIVLIIDQCFRTCDSIIATRLPPAEPKVKGTCYADPGLAGYMVPLSEGGWADSTCGTVSRTFKPGLCDRCYKQMMRWRERNGQKQLADDRVIDHDSHTEITADGVAHARPPRDSAA